MTFIILMTVLGLAVFVSMISLAHYLYIKYKSSSEDEAKKSYGDAAYYNMVMNALVGALTVVGTITSFYGSTKGTSGVR